MEENKMYARKSCSLILIFIFLFSVISSCAHIEPNRPEREKSKIGRVWSDAQRWYNPGWSWWKKLIYWGGPGH
jgi:hypothetical protein